MDADLQQKCFESLKALREMRDSNALPLPLFCKGLVGIAYEFALENEFSWVTKLLLEIPVFYFQNEQFDQMVEDPLYLAICTDFAKILVMNGLADNSAFIINQPPANA